MKQATAIHQACGLEWVHAYCEKRQILRNVT